ncbi:MAG: hypothetical protein JWM93_365 [Frankiales bacterium]|nr:hypothetical protein [Frankiales bacterium]
MQNQWSTPTVEVSAIVAELVKPIGRPSGGSISSSDYVD